MELTRCSVCGGALARGLAGVRDPESGETFAVAACASCGLGHTTPRPDDVGRYYGPVYYNGRHGLALRWCMRRRIRLLRRGLGRPLQGARVLDVGCGEGDFIAAAEEAGARCTGVELGAAVERGRQRGLQVHASLGDASGTAPFDAATLWHSLEHVPDPTATLTRIATMLSPSGMLLCAVPDAGGLQARLLRAHWLHLDVPRHLHHFSKSSMARLLEVTGFRLERWHHQELEYDMLGWMEGALDPWLPGRRVLFRLLATRRPPLTAGEAVLAAAAVVPLAAVALPLTWASAALGRGGTLVAVARRPG